MLINKLKAAIHTQHHGCKSWLLLDSMHVHIASTHSLKSLQNWIFWSLCNFLQRRETFPIIIPFEHSSIIHEIDDLLRT